MSLTRETVCSAVLTTFDGENEYFPYEFGDEQLINNGMCEEFALAVCAYLDNPENLEIACAERDQPELYGHVWLELVSNGAVICFDSENPEGVDSPHELNFFRRQ